jgi:hypothetical protein
MNRFRVAILSCVLVFGCKGSNQDWYLKSMKGNRITLRHDGKTFVAECEGEAYQTGPDKLLKTDCGYLTQYIGQTILGGDENHQVSRFGGDIIYWRSDKSENRRAYEVWKIVEETTD